MPDLFLNRLELTPGLRRAILRGVATEEGPLSAVSLLVGLLLEEESRAAAMLTKAGVSLETVRQHWEYLKLDDAVASTPLSIDSPLPPIQAELQTVFSAALSWGSSHGLPPELATEHALLGLLCEEATTDAGMWLREQGLSDIQVECEILQFTGMAVSDNPIDDWESLGEEDADSTCTRGQAPPLTGWHEPLSMPDDDQAIDQPGLPEEAIELIPVLRAFDASANRAREALRVVEDYVRFVLDDAYLTELFKILRHEMTVAVEAIPIGARLTARETQADVGTRISTPTERQRDDLRSLVGANFSRLQEALRSMEEFGKLIDPGMAAQLEQARYRTYTLHSAVESTRMSVDRLAGAQLYVLMNGGPSPEAFETLATELIRSGVDLIQLRDKQLDDRELLERARTLRQLTEGTGTLFIMNDRPDLAVLAAADGVHLGQEELSVKNARRVVGPDMLIGVSTHSIAQARAAVLDGASYIGVGPTFPSGTKQFDNFPGLDLLKAVAAEIRLPAFAIGGINAKNLPEVLATGFRRIAVSGGVLTAEEPSKAVLQLRDMLM